MLRIINQYERGVLFTLGRFSGILKPGLRIVIPILQELVKVDVRERAVDIPKQEVMTKDNVPVNINAVIYFKIYDPGKSVLNVENVYYATSKYGQAALRNVTGQATLDELLSERQKIADKLREIVDIATDPWGVDITKIELQDIELPENMKRVMAKQAEAERERRAVITKSEGEVKAADDIVNAAKTLYSTPGALQLRTLHTINDLSSDKSNTNIYVTPIEILRFFEKINDILDKINEDDIKKIKRLIKEKSINNHSGI
ncbi:MAG: slipin family protein [Candidatus Altiarchaeales archaeon]|nr:MAG: slipin family protein [Candidatus Altiarchaeales archaeon]